MIIFFSYGLNISKLEVREQSEQICSDYREFEFGTEEIVDESIEADTKSSFEVDDEIFKDVMTLVDRQEVPIELDHSQLAENEDAGISKLETNKEGQMGNNGIVAAEVDVPHVIKTDSSSG